MTLLFYVLNLFSLRHAYAVYETSNSDFDENFIQELAVIVAVLPVSDMIHLNCIAELTPGTPYF